MDFSNTRALLVGAGGIGCELLKTLCLHSFKEIFIVLARPAMTDVGRPRHDRFIEFKSTIPFPKCPYQEIKGSGFLAFGVAANVGCERSGAEV